MNIQYSGLITGVVTFLLIGMFHPVVIKTEYHFGTKPWPLFLIAGIILCLVSLFITNILLSTVMSITGIIFLWSIKELFEQKKRVDKGWYPKKDKKQ